MENKTITVYYADRNEKILGSDPVVATNNREAAALAFQRLDDADRFPDDGTLGVELVITGNGHGEEPTVWEHSGPASPFAPLP